ncbi:MULTISPECIES: bifunctional UDP-sugar hydrolase/5'-nucleotidase [Brevibacillus]|uniref:bifunctional metallophosphatase/5'-nucleotidase n=1 Tax=Brevibacillus TaxID=55080 RepID=UPI000D0E598E|nr:MULTISPECIES: bifunctional UDP-sugar hydrolase/5'-nucleotidase [Brevibacillus]MED1945773.1 bifunctional UDP-sugar hydrolase/5'-nucleotidase [Brevibacillus formosus]MED2000593.1 bifunctional UDP-sugar hydrolase/5'-nucleotidase [Brevibacillus formosus]MED2084560.1 bifunctional UDP-sugar hydrolase/5'-nucleotidase [Brevibacillus formosus]PSK15570.1 bifunctional metallophosphatase/5'-nucleotidase [Brevibacillus sp. NRRL NRS-603]
MADTCTLHILHTNDLHSHFDTMPRIATCLSKHREEWEGKGEHVLAVDIGDHMDRMDIRSEASFGKTNVEIMNRSGIQYATIGNNEGITLPKDKLNELYTDARFTIITGNLFEPTTNSVPSWAVPYAIHTVGELRLAILGMTIPFGPSYQSMGWEIKEPIPILREQIAALRSSVDVVILLSHLGYQTDCMLANEIDGLDIILGGHSHRVLPHGERLGGTLITQAGRFGEYVGHVKLVWDGKRRRITDMQAELLQPEQYQVDESLNQFIKREKAWAENRLFQPIVQLEQDMHIGWTEETPYGSFIAASIRKWTGAEIGMANGGLLLADLPRGSLSFADLLHSMPHPINACAVTITGAQLATVLEQAIQPEMVHRELRGYGFRGKIEGWMCVDGLHIRYSEDDQPQIIQIEVNGQPLDRERLYRVGTIDMFMYNRMFPDLLLGSEVTFFLPEMLREVLATTIKDQQMLQNAFRPRWEKISSPSKNQS